MKRPNNTYTLFLIICISLISKFSVTAQNTDSPNIIVFIADDMGWEESIPYGNKYIHTPNLESLAKKGMKFNNFYLTASSCSPSRLSILTSLYPHQTGAMNLHENITADIPLVVDNLRERGYYNMLVGKSHGTNNKKVQEKFDVLKLVNWSKPWEVGNDWVEALKNRPKNKPFFLWAASIDPHRPFNQGEYPFKHDPDSVSIPPYLPDIPEVRTELAQYYDEISRFDQHIGMALSELKVQGELENTIIFVLSDNGRAFAQSKTRVNAPGLKSPLIISYSFMPNKGKVSDGLISAVDITPTILDLAGAKPLPNTQGHSILPIIKNLDHQIRSYAFAEHNWHSVMAFERAVISKDYLYIKNWLPHLPATPPGDIVREPSYQAARDLFDQGNLAAIHSDSFIHPRPVEELFNLKNDIQCTTNLSRSAAQLNVLSDLRQQLAKWQLNTQDLFPGIENLKTDVIDRETGMRLKSEE